MKQAFRLSGVPAAAAALVLFFGAFISSTRAQTPSATPDSIVVQVTSSSPTPTPSPAPSPAPGITLPSNSFAGGISGNGRFVVIESTANLAPADPARPTTVEPNNADGNREIFLFDYAQRRIFQITNTKSALKSLTGLPTDLANIDVEVSNNRPVISQNGRWIAFSSNAYNDANGSNPASFNGNDNRDALKADGNQEIFLYFIPAVPSVDLSGGEEQPLVNLAGGTFTRLTNTPASAPPTSGSANVSPTSADDNRFPAVNDNASLVAFVSSRNLTTVNGGTNADGNPEIFVFNRTTGGISQITNTANPANSAINLVFNANPSLSADGSVIAFTSSADIPNAGPAEAANARGNAEIYITNFDGTNASNLRQVTRTPVDPSGRTVNVLSPGRRLSRDGNFLLFESTADISTSGTAGGTLQTALAIYLYNIGANSFTQVGPRPTVLDIQRFPTFTGDSSTIVFASGFNFRADGTVPTTASEGLNPNNRAQIFAAPVAAPNTFMRLTNTPAPGIADLQPFASDTIRRITFTFAGTELGGGNADFSPEVFYLIVPPAASEIPASANAVSYATGASDRPVAAASPAPTPPAVTGLAPGMLGIARSTTVALAPSNREVDKNNAREDMRRPTLPVELNGVSVSINNAAAGLFFVSPNQINFVVPPGLAASATALPVVINNNGAVIRSTLQINAAQPDIFTSTNGPGGRAAVLNVTNPLAQTTEPFSVTTDRPKADGSGNETVPTELLIMLTGVRNAQASQVTVRIGTTDLTGAAILSVGPSLTSGFDQIIVRLPATLAGAGDVPVIVSVAIGGQTFSSRPAESAPRIQIN